LAEKEGRPGHVRGDGIAQHPPGVVTWVAAGVIGVCQGSVGYCQHVAVVELLVAADVDET